jgi:hypothetical protein
MQTPSAMLLLFLLGVLQATVGAQEKPSLIRISTFGDEVFQAEPIGKKLLCCRTVGRIFLSNRDDALVPIFELLKPARTRSLMAVYGEHLYVPTDSNCIEIYRIQKDSLEFVSSTLPGQQVRVYGKELFAGDRSGLRCYSLKDPEAPALLGDMVLLDPPSSFQVIGDRLYAGHGQVLRVYDIAKRSEPELLGEYSFAERGIGALLVQPPYAYVFVSHSLRVCDVHKPEAIREIHAQRSSYQQYVWERDGGFVAHGLNDPVMLALSTPKRPQSMRALPAALPALRGFGGDFVLRDGRAEPSSNLFATGPLVGQHRISALAVVGERAFGVGDNGGVILDLSDAGYPEFSGSIPMSVVGYGQITAGDGVVATATSLIDCRGDSPKAVRGLPTYSGRAEGGVATADGQVWFAKSGEIQTWRIKAGIARRYFTQKIDDGLTFSRLQVRPPFLYAATNYGEVRIYEIDGDRLRQRGQLPSFATDSPSRRSLLMGLTLDGDFLHLAMTAVGVLTVDVSSPNAPVLHSRSGDHLHDAHNIVAQGGLCVVAAGGRGAQLLDMRPKGAGIHLATIPTVESAWTLARHGNYIYVPSRQAGIHILRTNIFSDD